MVTPKRKIKWFTKKLVISAEAPTKNCMSAFVLTWKLNLVKIVFVFVFFSSVYLVYVVSNVIFIRLKLDMKLQRTGLRTVRKRKDPTILSMWTLLLQIENQSLCQLRLSYKKSQQKIFSMEVNKKGLRAKSMSKRKLS